MRWILFVVGGAGSMGRSICMSGSAWAGTGNACEINQPTSLKGLVGG